MTSTTLPPLVCGIFKNGELIGLDEQPDPRERFAFHYNERAGRYGLTARPLADDELAAARTFLAEKGGASCK